MGRSWVYLGMTLGLLIQGGLGSNSEEGGEVGLLASPPALVLKEERKPTPPCPLPPRAEIPVFPDRNPLEVLPFPKDHAPPPLPSTSSTDGSSWKGARA
ncbi:hypothetical protein [Thermus sediminis]|uniref:hypothetical protein n=1 Tax=Thermus sediminis TaxID=1761908 RepID=UPI001E42F884|nr:hypothetical protein [Thermus sediminis]